MKSRARAFANAAPSTNRPGAGRVPTAKLEEWAKAAIPNAARILLSLAHADAVRKVAALPDNVKRSRILQEVERQAGRDAAEHIRRDTWALLQGRSVPA
jgi:hypothetical protein